MGREDVIVIDVGASLRDIVGSTLERARPMLPMVIVVPPLEAVIDTMKFMADLRPLPPEPKVGRNLNVGRYGSMPIPSGKRKKFKPSRKAKK